jgi:hypothetical protein
VTESKASDDLKQQDLCSDHNYAESIQKGRMQMTLRQMKTNIFRPAVSVNQ